MAVESVVQEVVDPETLIGNWDDRVVERLNGRLMAEVAKLWIKPDDLVVDCTYGKGAFWTEYQHLGPFVASDRYVMPARETLPARAQARLADCRDLGFPDETVDVVVFDPPYITTGTKAKTTVPEFYNSYGLDTGPQNKAQLALLMFGGMKEAKRVLVAGGLLMVKCSDYVESGRFQQGHLRVLLSARALGFEQVDEFILHSGPGPQPKANLDGSPRRQVHARRTHSFLCIFQKPKTKKGA